MGQRTGRFGHAGSVLLSPSCSTGPADSIEDHTRFRLTGTTSDGLIAADHTSQVAGGPIFASNRGGRVLSRFGPRKYLSRSTKYSSSLGSQQLGQPIVKIGPDVVPFVPRCWARRVV